MGGRKRGEGKGRESRGREEAKEERRWGRVMELGGEQEALVCFQEAPLWPWRCLPPPLHASPSRRRHLRPLPWWPRDVGSREGRGPWAGAAWVRTTGAGREGRASRGGCPGPLGASFRGLTPRGQPRALAAPQDVGDRGPFL